MTEATHTWPAIFGASHTTTVALPDALAPLARCLRDALAAHVRFQQHALGHVPQALAGYSHACGGPVPNGWIGSTIYAARPEYLDEQLAKAVQHLWRHVYGESLPTDDAKPSGYIRRLARQIDPVHAAHP